jgi:hypothetical protein
MNDNKKKILSFIFLLFLNINFFNWCKENCSDEDIIFTHNIHNYDLISNRFIIIFCIFLFFISRRLRCYFQTIRLLNIRQSTIQSTWNEITGCFNFTRHYIFFRLCLCYYKNDPLTLNFKFACQHCQSWQPEMRLDYSDTKIIQIFIVINRFSHSLEFKNSHYIKSYFSPSREGIK